MTWLLIVAVVAIGFWIPTVRRRMLLERAILFGREFYGVNLTAIVKQTRPIVLQRMKTTNLRTPQEVFFMLAPSVLGVLDGMKRLELFDGLVELKMHGQLNAEVYENFVFEYSNVSDDGYDWAADALGVR